MLDSPETSMPVCMSPLQVLPHGVPMALLTHLRLLSGPPGRGQPEACAGPTSSENRESARGQERVCQS